MVRIYRIVHKVTVFFGSCRFMLSLLNGSQILINKIGHHISCGSQTYKIYWFIYIYITNWFDLTIYSIGHMSHIYKYHIYSQFDL
jgi:hypothetical protein